jgi:mxaJ protein
MCLRSLRTVVSTAALAAVASSGGPDTRVEPAVQTSGQQAAALAGTPETEAAATFKVPGRRVPALQDGGGHDPRRVLRVCADPGVCDVIGGVPSRFDHILVTKPYYRSSYVFVTRQDRRLHLKTFDDPALKTLRIGVQLVGDDGQNTPPAHALAARHIVSNVVGYTVYGDYLQPNPPARIVEAVARNDVDVAIVWGPLAGYFARRYDVPLHISPVAPVVADPTTPVAFDISIGVARRVPALCKELDAALDRRRADVQRLLDEYGIPRVQS